MLRHVPASPPCHDVCTYFHHFLCPQFVTGVVVIGVVTWMVKNLGPGVAKLLDDRSEVRSAGGGVWKQGGGY